MDDLTRIKGIGPATAKKLAQAGITTFSALADAGLTALPPELAAIGSEVEWNVWANQATELAAEAGSRTPNAPGAGAQGEGEQGGAPDPSAPAAPDPNAEDGDGLAPTHVRIRAKPAQGFRRAGLRHGKDPVEHPIARFTDEQLAALLAEPNLVVELLTRDSRGEQAGGAA